MTKHILSMVILSLIVLDGQAKDKTYKSIFDGKTLKGWTQRNGTATYRVEKNAIVGKTKEGSPNSFLCSDKLYGNFDLKFEDLGRKLNQRILNEYGFRSENRRSRKDLSQKMEGSGQVLNRKWKT